MSAFGFDVAAQSKDGEAPNGDASDGDAPNGEATGDVNPFEAALDFPKGSPAASVVELAKIRLGWQSARGNLTTQVQLAGAKLAEVINDATGCGADFQAEFDAFVAPVATMFDERLGKAIDDLRNQADAAGRSATGNSITALIKTYRGFLADGGVLAKLESNPVVSVSVRQSFADVLDRLARVVG